MRICISTKVDMCSSRSISSFEGEKEQSSDVKERALGDNDFSLNIGKESEKALGHRRGTTLARCVLNNYRYESGNVT